MEDVFRTLRLKSRQKLAMLDEIQKRSQYFDAEESIIAKLHTTANDVFLNGNKNEISRFVNGGYLREMRRKLFVADGCIDYLTATGRDLSMAKAYLKTCGIKPGLLNHWAGGFDG